MPGNKYDCNSSVPTSRVSRLLQERQKRASPSSRSLQPTQRLLVVANRLPVSAVRKGEDSWSLEISAGGLVSALLGKNTIILFSMLALYYV